MSGFAGQLEPGPGVSPWVQVLLMCSAVLWWSVPVWRQVRLLRLGKRLDARVGFRTLSGERHGVRWELRFARRVTRSGLFARRGRRTPFVRIRVEAELTLSATNLEDEGLLSEGLGPGGPRLGDPRFDDVVALHGDPPVLAAVFTTELEQRVLGWVTQGGEICVDSLSIERVDRSDTAAIQGLEEALSLAVALLPPTDPHAARMERARSAEVGPSLRAAAAIGGNLPPDLAETLRRRARAQLTEGFLEVPALEALMELEPRSDDVSAAILPLLRARREEVRRGAVRALGRLGTRSAVPALRALPVGAPWQARRDTVDEAVAEINRSSDAGSTHAVR